jgi:hypothetical protein
MSNLFYTVLSYLIRKVAENTENLSKFLMQKNDIKEDLVSRLLKLNLMSF